MTTVITSTTITVILSLMEGLACARSLTVAILVRNGEWEQLANLECAPRDYSDSEAYWAAAQATAIVRKNKSLPSGLDLEAKAVNSFWESERTCYRTNRRLNPYVENGVNPDDANTQAIRSFIDRCRKIVKEAIWTRPPADLNGRLGPGATMSDTSRACTVPDKMSSVPTITPRAWPYVVPWLGTKWAACRDEGLSVKGNSFFTVPKSASSLRGCAKEPSLNSFYQLALGRVLKERLTKWGLDLVNAQRIHGRVARRSSIDDSYATIDLSSASDTVCVNLVRLMLPDEWFEALDRLRSPMTRVKGKWVVLEKFSSMGNGFTFELETLLFSVMIKALRPEFRPGKDFFVFGDDIIVPKESASDVIATLKFFGFSVNTGKTFTEGCFKESCGSDFFDGVRVRPYYLTEDPDEPQKLIAFANGLKRSAMDAVDNGAVETSPLVRSRWDSVRTAWFRILDQLPDHIRRLRGPQELGDLVIRDDQERWQIRWRASIRYIRVYRPARYRKVAFYRYHPDVQYAAALYGVTLRNDRWLIPRDGVLGYKVGWTPYS